jgi:hypothetical protein
VRDRRRSTSPTTSCHAASSAKSSGPLGGLVGRLGRDHAVDAERAPPARRPGDEVPDVVLVDEAPRVDEPLAVLAAGVGVGQAHLAAPDDGVLQQVDDGGPWPLALAPPGGVDHRRGRRRLGVRAERAGSARTSLRIAAFASSDTAAAGPTSRNSARASVARQPAEVGAGAADERPAAAAARLRVHRDAGGGERVEVPARGGDGDLELGRQLGRRDPPAGLHEQEGGDEPVCAHTRNLPDKVLSG